MKRGRLFAILVIGLIIIGGLIVWPLLRTSRLSKAFTGIKRNDTKDMVLKQMGSPWKNERCGAYLGGFPPGCAEEFIYAHPYAPYLPEYWIIYFDSNHQVISSAHLVSP